MLQQKIVTTLMLLLLILLTPYLVMSEETTVTCVAPPVNEGQPGQLTCNFNRDLSKLGDYIATVEFYPPGEKDPTQIIECHLAQGTKGCSSVKEGYTFDETIDTHLRLDMTNVSTSNVGSYLCKLSSTEIRADLVPCSFNIADMEPPDPTTTTTATTPGEDVTIQAVKESESGFPFIPVAVGVAAGVGIAAVVIIIIICRRKRRQSRPAEDAESQKLTDTSTNYSKSAVDTTGKSAPDDDNPPPIPERAPILQEKVYDDQWRGEDGDEQPINAMSFPATDTEPPQKPPRSYELHSHEDDTGVMSAAEKEETDETKDPMLKEDAVFEPVEAIKPATTQ